MSLSVAVVTAATGAEELDKCVYSINQQTYPCKHYLFFDGVVNYSTYCDMVAQYTAINREVAYWPGKINTIKGQNVQGRRIYAAAPSLINEDITIFLNEDDWFKPNHIESLVTLIEKNDLSWAYSLRSIFDKHGNYLFNDNCESLGAFPGFNGLHLVETCSYAVKTEAMINCANAYNYRGFGPDRIQYKFLSENYPNFGCTGLHTMCFRLGGNLTSVSREFLETGNKLMQEKYMGEVFPWRKETVWKHEVQSQ